LKKNNDVGEEHHKEVEELCLENLGNLGGEKSFIATTKAS